MAYKQPPIEYQWKKGQTGNAGGRPKDTLKEYSRKKFQEMSDKEKDVFLKSVAPELQWRMSEGNPHQETTGDGNKTLILIAPQESIDRYAIKEKND